RTAFDDPNPMIGSCSPVEGIARVGSRSCARRRPGCASKGARADIFRTKSRREMLMLPPCGGARSAGDDSARYRGTPAASMLERVGLDYPTLATASERAA